MNVLIQAFVVICSIMTSHRSDAGMRNPNKAYVTGQCREIQLANGSTCKAAGSQSMCTFKCDNEYELIGPEVIYCYNRKWYEYSKVNKIGKVASSLYKLDTRCRKIPGSGLARDFTATDPQCSAQTCHRAFPGITESGCLHQGCCWSEDSRTCHENHCADTFPGIPKEACELIECTYDDTTRNCYKALPPVLVAPPSPQCSEKNCIKAYRGITKSGCTNLGCCWHQASKTCRENQCRNTFRGIPKSMCEQKGCVFDDATHVCYKKSFSISSRSFNLQPRLAGDFADFKPVQCPPLENDDHNMVISCPDERYVGSVCTIKCGGVRILRGDSDIACLPSGSWSASKEEIKAFHCQEIQTRQKMCSEQPCAVSFPGMSRKSCETEGCCWNEDKQSCTSDQCPFTFKGIPKSKCLERGCAYNPQNLQCYVATRCPLIPESAGLTKRCTHENEPNSFCWFNCPPDLVLNGPSHTICGQKNGKWRGLIQLAGNKWTDMTGYTQPRCHAKNCPPLPTPSDGVKMSCTAGHNVSSICRFSCSSSSDELHGPAQTSCQDNGKWSNVEYPTCERACALSANLKSGAVSVRENQNLVKLTGPLEDAGRAGECSKQGVIEVEYSQMTNFKLDLSYPGEVSGFHITVKNEQDDIVAFSYNKELYISSTNDVVDLFGENRQISLDFDRIDGTLVYAVEELGQIPEVEVAKLPMLMTSKKLFFHIHRNSFSTGKGICDVCASFISV